MKRIFTLLTLLFFTSVAFSQKDTIIYYSKLGKVITDTTKSLYCDKVKKATEKVCFLERYTHQKNKWVHVDDDRKMRKLNDTTFLIFSKITAPKDTIFRVIKKIKSGYFIKDKQNKVLVATGVSRMIIPLVKEGHWVNKYQLNNKPQSEEDYNANQLIGNKRWKVTGEEDISDALDCAETDPQFQGGSEALKKFLSTNTAYPGRSYRRGEEGIVTAQFIVMEDGSINGVEIVKSISPSLDAESIRVLKAMPKWIPGQIEGKNVRVILQIPFLYTLPKI